MEKNAPVLDPPEKPRPHLRKLSARKTGNRTVAVLSRDAEFLKRIRRAARLAAVLLMPHREASAFRKIVLGRKPAAAVLDVDTVAGGGNMAMSLRFESCHVPFVGFTEDCGMVEEDLYNSSYNAVIDKNVPIVHMSRVLTCFTGCRRSRAD